MMYHNVRDYFVALYYNNKLRIVDKTFIVSKFTSEVRKCNK